MPHFKFIFFILVILFSLKGLAQEEPAVIAADPAPPSEVSIATTATAPAIKLPRRRTRPVRFGKSIGVGYIQWNEKMELHQGATSSEGLATYAGPAINFDFNWNGSWWMTGLSSSISAGKAASGGFKELDFFDGVNRSWYGFVFSPYALYRITPRFLLGGGVIARLTWADWEPADQSLTVEAQSGAQIAPSLQLRYRLTPKAEFVNSFGFFGPTESQWILSANWNL